MCNQIAAKSIFRQSDKKIKDKKQVNSLSRQRFTQNLRKKLKLNNEISKFAGKEAIYTQKIK